MVTQLTYDATDDVWQGTFALPAGTFHYLAALNGSFDEIYGANATPGGTEITLTLAQPTTVKFYYDNKTHWITDNKNAVIVTAPGDYQSELGCPGDFEPDCLRSWLEDPDGNGIYQFSTTAIPAGTYKTRATINESFDENYGAGGVPGGADIGFTVPASATVTFSYDPVSHVLSVTSTTNTVTSITADAPDPSAVGQPVTVQYSVAPATGSGTPTGTVTVSDGTTSCTGTVAAGAVLADVHQRRHREPDGQLHRRRHLQPQHLRARITHRQRGEHAANGDRHQRPVLGEHHGQRADQPHAVRRQRRPPDAHGGLRQQPEPGSRRQHRARRHRNQPHDERHSRRQEARPGNHHA
jgi:hypothetical protein